MGEIVWLSMFEGIVEAVGNIASVAGAAASGMSGLNMSVAPMTPSAGPSVGDSGDNGAYAALQESSRGIMGNVLNGGGSGDFSPADHPTGKAFESTSAGGDGGQHQASNTSGAHAEHQGPAGESGSGGGNSGSRGGGGEGGESGKNFEISENNVGKKITQQFLRSMKKFEHGVTAIALNIGALSTGSHPGTVIGATARGTTRAASRGIVALVRLLTGKA